MTLDQILSLFTGDLIPLTIKLALLLLIFLYGIFAAVILRQIQLMNKVVTEVNFSPVLVFVAVIHFVLVVGLFILTVILL